MIYYFSGTGNSKWVAKELARRTGDEAKSIPSLMEYDSPAALSANDTRIGIVFPVYAWGAPLLVERFCRSLQTGKDAYLYTVCTCGDETGKALMRLKRFFDWKGAWSLAMPGNYIIGFDVDNPALERQKIAAAREKLARIADGILAKNSVYDVHEGGGAGVKTAIVRPMFNAYARRTKPFAATDACNGCGLCERICPVKAIKLEDGVPRWVRKHCMQCMGCINRCPQKAIQYGHGTLSKGRYYFHEE
jgi:ferredoxin/flavodoxin